MVLSSVIMISLNNIFIRIEHYIISHAHSVFIVLSAAVIIHLHKFIMYYVSISARSLHCIDSTLHTPFHLSHTDLGFGGPWL